MDGWNVEMTSTSSTVKDIVNCIRSRSCRTLLITGRHGAGKSRMCGDALAACSECKVRHWDPVSTGMLLPDSVEMKLMMTRAETLVVLADDVDVAITTVKGGGTAMLAAISKLHASAATAADAAAAAADATAAGAAADAANATAATADAADAADATADAADATAATAATADENKTNYKRVMLIMIAAAFDSSDRVMQAIAKKVDRHLTIDAIVKRHGMGNDDAYGYAQRDGYDDDPESDDCSDGCGGNDIGGICGGDMEGIPSTRLPDSAIMLKALVDATLMSWKARDVGDDRLTSVAQAILRRAMHRHQA